MTQLSVRSWARLSAPASAVALSSFLLTAPVLGQAATLTYPDAAIEGAELEARATAQRKATETLSVQHGFRFEDRVATSGIDFENRVVEDAGKAYKPVHYDHGTGIAVADVDGDKVLDLYFTNQVGANALFKGRGDGTFQNITAKAGVGVADRISVSASFGDIDNDGDPDLFVTTVKMGNLLFENNGKGVFEDITAKAGVGYVGHSSGSIFFDYDKDGLLDLFVANVGTYTTDEKGPDGYWVGVERAFWGHLLPERTEASILYRNLGGNRFQNVSEKALLVDRGWAGDASIADFNGDGWPDLYVLNMQGDDHAYQNVGGRFFVEKGAQLFPKTPWGSMGVKFFDYDNDGDQDAVLTDMHSDMSEEIGPDREKLKSRMQWEDEMLQDGSNNVFGNAFYRNKGDGTYEEISDAVGTENYWPWGVSTGDVNADGWEDILITSSMNYPFRYGVNSLLLNERGKGFADTEFVLGIEPQKGELTTPWFEVDCAGADAGHQHCKEGDGKIQVFSSVGTRSAAIFDIDADGDLDIVTNEFGAEPQVLVSDLAGQHDIAWLEVALTGTASNRDGIGAKVAVTAGDHTLTKVLDGKSGYLSQSIMPLYFGLTGSTSIKRIEITWPSGRVQTIPGPIATNRRLELTEPAATEDGAQDTDS